MSGYFARLAQRSGDAAFTQAPHATPASSAYDAAPAGEEAGIELERSETIEAQPTAPPASMSMPVVPVSSAGADEPTTPDIAPPVLARHVVEEIVEHRQAETPRQAIGQPDRSAISARAHRSPTTSDQAAPSRAQSVATPHLPNPRSLEAPSRPTAVAAASPNDARTESALSAPGPHASTQIEMHQTVDPIPRAQAESAVSTVLPDTRERLREAHIDPAPRARVRAATSRSAAASVPHASTPPPTPLPARGGVEVSIGRIEMEITAAAPPVAASAAQAPTRAPRPAPAFNPHRHYLRGG